MKKGGKTKKKAGASKEKGVPPGLRQRALEQMKRGRTDLSKMQTEEVEELVQELQIHQVELEIQNEDLRLAQVELAEARDMYLDLYESAPVGYLTIDGKHVIRKANLKAAALLGVDRSKLIGARFERFAAAEGRDSIYVAVQDALASGEEQTCEVEFQRPDGSQFFGKFVVSRKDAEKSGDPVFLLALRDVSQEKVIQEERDETLGLLELLYRTAPVGLCHLDRELRFVRINERLAEINGKSIAEHMGRTVREVIPQIADFAEQTFQEILQTGEAVLDREMTGETHAQPGVKRSWLEDWWPLKDEQSQIVGVSIVVKEITELKKAQEELKSLNETLEQRVEERTRQFQESQERYRYRIDSIPHMVWSILADGTGEYCDRQTLEYLGVTMDQIREMDWVEWLHPEEREWAAGELAEIMRTGRKAQADLRIRRGRDGAYQWHSVHVVPMLDEEGRILRWLGTCTNIQQRKEAEGRLQQMSRVFQEAAVPILLQDEEGRVFDMNAEAEQALEWKTEELTGKSVKTILPPEEYEAFDLLLAWCADGQPPKGEEVELITQSGRRIPTLVTLSVLSGEMQDGPRRIALIAKDVSRLKRAEAALRSSERALREEKRKLEEKNIALQEILELVEVEKSKIRGDMGDHLQDSVFPLLDRLAGQAHGDPLLAMLRSELEGLSSSLGRRMPDGRARLTPKEKEVCQMLKGGLTSKEISGILGCSHQTVEKHRKNIRKKLGIVGTGTHLGAFLNES